MCKGTKNNSNYRRNSPKLLTNEEFLDLCIPSSSITVTVVMISISVIFVGCRLRIF